MRQRRNKRVRVARRHNPVRGGIAGVGHGYESACPHIGTSEDERPGVGTGPHPVTKLFGRQRHGRTLETTFEVGRSDAEVTVVDIDRE